MSNLMPWKMQGYQSFIFDLSREGDLGREKYADSVDLSAERNHASRIGFTDSKRKSD